MYEHCTVPGLVALTFDDGPYKFTSLILDYLDKYKAKATFFINGENFSRLDDPSQEWIGILKRMAESGHQVGSHTWSHANLMEIDLPTRQNQIRQLEQVVGNAIGKTPTYLRPPYGYCWDECINQMESMGYRVVNYDLDTKDYLYNAPGAIEASKAVFSSALDSGPPSKQSFIVLCHDVLEQTATALVPFMLDKIKQSGYKAVTVRECLGDPPENWYRPVSDSNHPVKPAQTNNNNNNNNNDNNDNDDAKPRPSSPQKPPTTVPARPISPSAKSEGSRHKPCLHWYGGQFKRTGFFDVFPLSWFLAVLVDVGFLLLVKH